MEQNNSSHAVDPNKSSVSSPPQEPPVATPSETALTGISVVDDCVRDHRMVDKILADLRIGRVRGSLEAIMQARMLLLMMGNAKAISLIDDALEREGVTADELRREMPRAATRRGAVGAYIRAGEQCYEVSPGLAERLSVTELRGVTGDSLRLPFESIAIAVPPSLWDLAKVVFVRIVRPCSRDRVDGNAPSQRVLSMVAYRKSTGVDTFSINPTLDERDIRIALNESLSRCQNVESRPDVEGTKEHLALIFWWTINVCLYITNGGAQIEPRHPNADAECRWQALNAEPGPKRG